MSSSKNWWMSPEQFTEYELLSISIADLAVEHRKLIQKLKARDIKKTELERLNSVIDEFNAKQSKRRELEEQNPLLAENILKLLKRSQD